MTPAVQDLSVAPSENGSEPQSECVRAAFYLCHFSTSSWIELWQKHWNTTQELSALEGATSPTSILQMTSMGWQDRRTRLKGPGGICEHLPNVEWKSVQRKPNWWQMVPRYHSTSNHQEPKPANSFEAQVPSCYNIRRIQTRNHGQDSPNYSSTCQIENNMERQEHHSQIKAQVHASNGYLKAPFETWTLTAN